MNTMKKITIYQAVCSTHGQKCWWTPGIEWFDNEDDAKRRAYQHTGVKNGAGKIERIDTREVWDQDFYGF